MLSALSTLGMLRYWVRAPTFVLLLVVLAEVAANGSSSSPDSLPFPAPPIGRQIAHHAAHFLPILVGTHEFCATYVRFKEREKYWNDGLVHVF